MVLREQEVQDNIVNEVDQWDNQLMLPKSLRRADGDQGGTETNCCGHIIGLLFITT